MKILVTGTNGFIGRAVCGKLEQFDHELLRVVRYVTGLSGEVAVGGIGPGTEWKGCLRDTLGERDGKVTEVVVHLAGRVHVMRDRVDDPLAEFRRVNVEGTLNLARQAAQSGVRRFIFVSSIKVNGEETEPGKPFTERDIPGPIDPYAISKYEAEQGLLELVSETHMDVVIIRPPLVYGPGVKANFFSMMKWLSKGIPLPLGAIQNKRSLVALDNLVDLIVTCVEHPSAANQIFLVSDGEDLSTTQLLRRIAAALNISARLVPVPRALLEFGATMLGKKEVAKRLLGSLQVDITKASDLLGWTPPVSMDQALQETARHFLEQSPP